MSELTLAGWVVWGFVMLGALVMYAALGIWLIARTDEHGESPQIPWWAFILFFPVLVVVALLMALAMGGRSRR